LISNLFFVHNLNIKSLNGKCEPIFNVHISKPFQIFILKTYFEHYFIFSFLFQKFNTPWDSTSHNEKKYLKMLKLTFSHLWECVWVLIYSPSWLPLSCLNFTHKPKTQDRTL
jgi:hypothetical protein